MLHVIIYERGTVPLRMGFDIMKKCLALMLVVLFLFVLVACNKKEQDVAVSPTPTPTPDPTPIVDNSKKFSLTTGLLYEEDTVYHPIGIMVENSSGARPQTGLQQADIIYEVIAEGDITRFFTIFNDTHPIQVGPVRSARIYYVNIQREWDIPYVHYGGPAGAGVFGVEGSNVAHIKVRVNGMVDSKHFWRSSDRKAPHNVYTDVTKINDDLYNYTPEYRNQFQFDEAVDLSGGTDFTKVKLPFVTNNNDFVSFTYDGTTGLLTRLEKGKVFQNTTVTEVDGKKSSATAPLTVKNLVVQYADTKMAPGSTNGHRLVELTGSGNCEFFIGGKHFSGKWSRSSLNAATSYTLIDGTPLTLLPGNTWVAVHPSNKTIVVE